MFLRHVPMRDTLLAKRPPSRLAAAVVLVGLIGLLARGRDVTSLVVAEAVEARQAGSTTARATPVLSLAVSPEGQLLAVPRQGEVWLVDTKELAAGRLTVVDKLAPAPRRTEEVRFSPDGTHLAVVGGTPGENGQWQIWEVAAGRQSKAGELTDDVLLSCSWSPRGDVLAISSTEGKLHLLDVTTGQMKYAKSLHTDWGLDTAFSADGKLIVSAGRERAIKIAAAETGQLRENLTTVSPGVNEAAVSCLARAPGAELLAAGGADGSLRTFRIERQVERKIGDDNNLLWLYPDQLGPVCDMAFVADGSQLVAAGYEESWQQGVASHRGWLRLWKAPSLDDPPPWIQAIQGMAIGKQTAEQRELLAAFHRADSNRAVPNRPAGFNGEFDGAFSAVYAVDCSPAGEWVFAGTATGELLVHELETGRLRARFNLPPESDTTPPRPAPSSTSRPRFLTDIMPVLSRAGCNAGTCHGAAQGQNGFKLSLRGYDPKSDYLALTRELKGRRVDLQQPENSLMLLKATESISHGGGTVLEDDTRHYQLLRDWIATGANYDETAPRVRAIELQPASPMLKAAGQEAQFTVTARYTDGTQRDVTTDAFLTASDPEVARVNSQGTARGLRRGETPVVARYQGQYAAAQLTVLGKRDGFQWQPRPIYSPIDMLVDEKLKRLRIQPSDLCTDEEFLRRVSLDLTGCLPTPSQIVEFSLDARPQREKRKARVDTLIGSPAYLDLRANRWATLLRVSSKTLGDEPTVWFHDWIREQLAANRPYDEFVYDLLSVQGSAKTAPQAGYYKTLRTPERLVEASTQLFLGVRFSCNRCHDHPFERWTQADHQALAAYFAEVQLKEDPQSKGRQVPGTAVEPARPWLELVVDVKNEDAVDHNATRRVAPRFPYQHSYQSLRAATRRQALARWLVSAENRYFARSYVNRVWAELTGVGLIEPVDDLRAGNPPTNPRLLDWLTEQFVASDFDVQALERTICTSRTYQLSSRTTRWNREDQRNYSHAQLRRLPAEVLYDAIHQAVGAKPIWKAAGQQYGKAVNLPDSELGSRGGLLKSLGRPQRESVCACERDSSLEMPALLGLLNGDDVATALSSPENQLARLEQELDNEQLVEAIFLRVLSRKPSETERQQGVSTLTAAQPVQPAVKAELDSLRDGLLKAFTAWRKQNYPPVWTSLDQPSLEPQLEPQPPQQPEPEPDKQLNVLSSHGTSEGGKFSGLRLRFTSGLESPVAPQAAKIALKEIRVQIARPSSPEQWRNVKLREVLAEASEDGFPSVNAIDGKPESEWRFKPAESGTQLVLVLSRPMGYSAGTLVRVEVQAAKEQLQSIAELVLQVTADAKPKLVPSHPAEINQLLSADFLSLPTPSQQRLRQYYLEQNHEFTDFRRAIALVENARLAALQDLVWALINSPEFLFNH